jgi:hypothetical protein
MTFRTDAEDDYYDDEFARNEIREVETNDESRTRVRTWLDWPRTARRLHELIDAMHANRTVLSLHVDRRMLSAPLVSDFAAMLDANTTLRKLFVDGGDPPRAGDDAAGLCLLIDAWSRTERLHKLVLQSVWISPDAARALALHLASSQNLRKLSICECPTFDDAACSLLAAALECNPPLAWLTLDSRDGFTAAGARALLDALHANYRLATIVWPPAADAQPLGYLRDDLRLSCRAVVAGNRFVAANVATSLPLGAALSPSGAFDVLPNELMCAVALHVWPPRSALTVSQVCRRWRDVMHGNYVVQRRHGTDSRGRHCFGHRRLFYRDAWLESLM